MLRTKTTSEIAKKTVNEEECRGKVRVLDQPDKWCIYRVPSKLRKGPLSSTSPWLRKAVEQDLILFENQLPYSLLQELYHDFAVPVSRSFQPCKENRVKPKHFTDLVRHFLCPDKEMDCEHNNAPVKNIYAAKKLRASGVKFRPLKDGPLIIRKMRPLNLVDTVDDVVLPVENKVILNMLGSNEAVAKLVNRLCEQIMDDKSCYFDICEQLNKHYENFWNRHVATLKRVYFKDLWTGSSTVLGVVVLVFSVIGTIKSLKSVNSLLSRKPLTGQQVNFLLCASMPLLAMKILADFLKIDNLCSELLIFKQAIVNLGEEYLPTWKAFEQAELGPFSPEGAEVARLEDYELELHYGTVVQAEKEFKVRWKQLDV
ncbi:iron-regulated transporter 1 [Prunus dulcis]|uniref:Iron-regulated transporter 1 n=1 Tax=Prunus dulcis TaxID=3755 RepID=A0A4Y1QZN7_PRUDU|nr:iron-regulated transporter 1 [Prunus dulcis]